MLEPRFCYRILADAGMAHDKNGNNASCFTEVNFEGGSKINQDKYDRLHEEFRHGLAVQLGIDEKHLECISQKEYDDNQ
ncbi:hypothetical protein NQS36_16220 [Bacillus sp. C1(2022)]|jgi:hypothetical protein|uniref:hypothetical protein n=1 Tax=Bacillus TaxID=1386 RepID=UPI00098AD415|nr:MULTISPECIES: hypothetical protein [Bacillus subtilis group]MBA1159597.1 hypothetical protein [Bacillus licheniformis]MDE1436914.1 hypothetical protein [Bacillus licheniformis]MEC1810919.1 hypothetical protein [Bacillus licheniformis]MED0839004.1 hypothetical protein [Bacillus licheniformis]MED0840845.1 hypothetical protein [Bacillus licheniformis]